MRALVLPTAALAAVLLLAVAVSALGQSRQAAEFPSFFFDLGGYTETWLKLTPAPLSGEAGSSCVLNFTIRYRGKPVEGPLPHAPQAIVVRAESNPLYNPRIIRHAVFVVTADGLPAWDPALALRFFSSGAPCEDCVTTADTVEATIPVDALLRIAAAQTVEGNAMGLPFSLNTEQIRTLGRFVTKVTPASP